MGTAVKTSPITAARPFTVAPDNEREGQTILLFTLLVCRTRHRRVKRLLTSLQVLSRNASRGGAEF